jgi:hypothetical protein
VFRKTIQKYMAVLRHHDPTIAQQLQDEGFSKPPADPDEDQKARIKMFIAYYERFITEAEGTSRALKTDAGSKRMRQHNVHRLNAMESIEEPIDEDVILLADGRKPPPPRRGGGGGRGRGDGRGRGRGGGGRASGVDTLDRGREHIHSTEAASTI